MNLNQHNPNSLRRFAIFALLFLLGIAPALAKPRLPAPPWPEIGNLFCESFDQPYSFPTNQTIDSAVWAESWSGYSLVRSRLRAGKPIPAKTADLAEATADFMVSYAS